MDSLQEEWSKNKKGNITEAHMYVLFVISFKHWSAELTFLNTLKNCGYFMFQRVLSVSTPKNISQGILKNYMKKHISIGYHYCSSLHVVKEMLIPH